MAWCEANTVDYVFGLARNARLEARIADALAEAERLSSGRARQAGAGVSRLPWSTQGELDAPAAGDRQGRGRGGEANPRFIVTSLKPDAWRASALYEKLYCARGEMENRIKECQFDLFADRTSSATMRANQLRLWFAAMAYVLVCALRRIGLPTPSSPTRPAARSA